MILFNILEHKKLLEVSRKKRGWQIGQKELQYDSKTILLNYQSTRSYEKYRDNKKTDKLFKGNCRMILKQFYWIYQNTRYTRVYQSIRSYGKYLDNKEADKLVKENFSMPPKAIILNIPEHQDIIIIEATRRLTKGDINMILKLSYSLNELTKSIKATRKLSIWTQKITGSLKLPYCRHQSMKISRQLDNLAIENLSITLK